MAPKKDKETGLNKKYVPSSLTPSQKQKQVKSIKEQKPRPKLKGVPSRRSQYTIKAERYFGKGNTSVSDIAKKLKIPTTGLYAIKKKGEKAYFTSGSRPNQTPQSWGYARLFSVLFGGKARNIDKEEVKKYNIPLLK